VEEKVADREERRGRNGGQRGGWSCSCGRWWSPVPDYNWGCLRQRECPFQQDNHKS